MTVQSQNWVKLPKQGSPSTYEHVTVEDIAAKAKLPLRAPGAVAREARQWAAEHPARIGANDLLTLEVKGGPQGASELLRNGSSEFYASGSQGSHDSDHVMFGSFFEQLGGRPLMAASPLNEMTVNCFEWELEPHWKSHRQAEMTQMGIDPQAPDAFQKLEIEQALRGAAQVVHNSLAESRWARGLFCLTGRDPKSFPNSTELDYSLRIATASNQSLHSIAARLARYTQLGTQLARRVRDTFPEVVESANQWSHQVELVKGQSGAQAHVECLQLPTSPDFQNQVAPLVEEMNGILESLPAAYVHGFASPVGQQPARLRLATGTASAGPMVVPNES
jgi:hypothetical protein